MDMTTYKKVVAARDGMLKWLEEGLRNWKETACIAIVYEDSVHISPNQACHAGLSDSYRGMKDKGALAVINGLMKPSKIDGILDEKEAFIFLDWLLNRSPYASTFISKDVRECLYTHTTISDAHTPSNLMAAGMVASRRLWEYPFIARVFASLVKAGVQEDLAYYLGHIAMGEFDRTGKFTWSGVKAGHCSINTYRMGSDCLKAFLLHTPTTLNKTYNESKNYESYHAMYQAGGMAIGSWIHDNFPYEPLEEKKVINPFPVARKDGKSCSYDYAIETMATFQHEILKQIGYYKIEEKAA